MPDELRILFPISVDGRQGHYYVENGHVHVAICGFSGEVTLGERSAEPVALALARALCANEQGRS